MRETKRFRGPLSGLSNYEDSESKPGFNRLGSDLRETKRLRGPLSGLNYFKIGPKCRKESYLTYC